MDTVLCMIWMSGSAHGVRDGVYGLVAAVADDFPAAAGAWPARRTERRDEATSRHDATRTEATIRLIIEVSCSCFVVSPRDSPGHHP
jgi:hypothetical protein